MTKTKKRYLMQKIQAAIDYSEMKATIDGISCRGKLPRFLATAADPNKALSVWPCITQFFGSWNGFELLLNGELWIHCSRCNWPHLASGFGENGLCAYCNGPRSYYKPDPIKVKARAETRKAIKDGRVRSKPANCEDCGELDDYLNIHHKDYSAPLDIEWLCNACHGKRHRGNRRYYSFSSHVEARMAWI